LLEVGAASFIELIFGFSLFINAALFLPQIFKIIKNKSANNLSLLTFFGFNFIQAVTVIRGYVVHDYVLMLGFFLSFVTCGAVTGLIIFYRIKSIRRC